MGSYRSFSGFMFLSVLIDQGLAEQRDSGPHKADKSHAKNKPDESIAETKKKGFEGVDFSYDVFGAPPGQDPQKIAEEGKAKDITDKPKVMAKQKQLLADRYSLECRKEPSSTMTKGKPQPIGPTAQLKDGLTWDKLGGLDGEEIKHKKLFPAGFHRLPHVKHEVGGMVFPSMQIKQFPRLDRFVVEFDLPDCFLPEFPPPIFLTTHSELGDVSQGEVVNAENFDRLFRGLITPAQLDGLRILVTQFPEEEFNATHDRHLPRLSCQFPHNRPIPLESRYQAAGGSAPSRYDEPPGSLQPADPWI